MKTNIGFGNIGYVRPYIMMKAISCYLEWDNYKILKIHMNNSSYFKISAALF